MLLLRARSPVTFREIREQFSAYKTANAEAGLRAFERDKADLLDLGVPIRYITPEQDDALEEGGYVVNLKRYRMPEVALTAEEISALVLAASVARAVPGGNYPKIVDLALRKLAFDTQELPDTPAEFPPASGHPRRDPVLVHFPANRAANAREISERFAQLEAATRNRKRITVSYQSAGTGAIQTRDIDPYALVYRERSWLLVGHCHLRAEIRSFRVDRILSLRSAPRPKSRDFERPADFDARTYIARTPWTFTPEPSERVVLEILPEAADTINEDFGPDAERNPAAVLPDESPGHSKTEDADADTTRIAFQCGNPDYVTSRVLAAKGAIRVLAGPQARQRIRDELATIEEYYRE
jgi:proteasome accessory factor B